MFEKVLFPTDFSECNLKILDYLSELKKVGVKEIILIRVINLNRVTGIAGGIDIEEYIESEEKEAENSKTGQTFHGQSPCNFRISEYISKSNILNTHCLQKEVNPIFCHSWADSSGSRNPESVR